MKIKIILYLLTTIFFLSNIYSNTCISETDEIIIKCTIPEHYFIQDFTCLNDDCSIKIENKGKFQELIIPNSEKTIILKNYIELKDVYKDFSVLNNLCKENFDENTLVELDSISKEYFSKKFKSFSGDKFTIEQYSEKRFNDLLEINKKDKINLEECYITNVEKKGDWLFKSKEKKNYCEIKYNNENDCFETKIIKSKFLIFLILNPSSNTLPYIGLIFLILGIIGSFSIFITHLKKNNKLKKFLKPSKHKLIIKLIILIPSLYLFGIIINYLSNQKYYFFVSVWIEILLIIVALIILYFLSAILEYIFNEK